MGAINPGRRFFKNISTKGGDYLGGRGGGLIDRWLLFKEIQFSKLVINLMLDKKEQITGLIFHEAQFSLFFSEE